MNSSELRRTALSYLGCRKDVTPQMTALLEEGLSEAQRLSRFRAVAKTFEKPLSFLRQEPYAAFLAGCTGYALVAMTLGAEGERRVRALMTLDPARAVVLDACLSAYIEYEGDRWESCLGENRTYRFCPGYGGSDVSDNRYLFAALEPSRIGMQLLPSGMMAPQKSMVGIVGLGKKAVKSCADCMAAAGCIYRKEGRRCYDSGKSF